MAGRQTTEAGRIRNKEDKRLWEFVYASKCKLTNLMMNNFLQMNLSTKYSNSEWRIPFPFLPVNHFRCLPFASMR